MEALNATATIRGNRRHYRTPPWRIAIRSEPKQHRQEQGNGTFGHPPVDDRERDPRSGRSTRATILVRVPNGVANEPSRSTDHR